MNNKNINDARAMMDSIAEDLVSVQPMPANTLKALLYLTSPMESTDAGIVRKLLENLQAYKKACDNPSISQAYEYVTKLKVKSEVLGEIIDHIKLLKKVNSDV